MTAEAHNRTEVLELAELERELQERRDDVQRLQETIPALLNRSPAMREGLADVLKEWEALAPAVDRLRERIADAREDALQRISRILDGGP